MRKFITVTVLLMLLFITSCDRFEHSFKQVDFDRVLFSPMQTSFNTGSDFEAALNYFADDYLQNGIIKSDRRGWLQGLNSRVGSLSFEVALLQHEIILESDQDTLVNVDWRLKVYNNDNSLIADSIFTGDRIVKRDNKWLIYGNGLGINFDTVVFHPVQAALSDLTPNSLNRILDFYDEDYLHNGQLKANRESFYAGMFNLTANPVFEAVLQYQAQLNDTLAVSNWRLRITNGADSVLADSTFIGERLVKRNGKWLLFGNRANCCITPTAKQRVFIETFTFTTCPSCPAVEAILKNLQDTHPNNLSYLEYHNNDALDIGNDDIYSYYGYPDMPSVIFQGETMILGNNADNATVFGQLVTQLADENSDININNLNYTLSGQTLTGSIKIKLNDPLINQTQLKLKYVILDKESDTFTNEEGEPCHNVVIAKGFRSLEGVDLNSPVNFTLPFSSLPLSYNGNLPVDSYLVIWVQATPDPFNNNARVFNALETPLTVNRHKRSK